MEAVLLRIKIFLFREDLWRIRDQILVGFRRTVAEQIVHARVWSMLEQAEWARAFRMGGA